MSECVLDASAILACLNGEPGGDVIERLVRENKCWVSAVNYAEVLARLHDWEMSVENAIEVVATLELRMAQFDEADAARCAALRPVTRSKGLSLGDRACLALAQRTATCVVYTADRPWLDLAVPLGLDIRGIRPGAH